MAQLSPAHRAPYATSGFANAFRDYQDDELTISKPYQQQQQTPPPLEKQGSKLGRFLSHVHERLVMKLVCCAPASMVLEVEFEDEDFCRPENTEINKIGHSLLVLKKQKSASVVPMLQNKPPKSSHPQYITQQRVDSDRDIPTNDELERLPIDLSFVLNNNDDDDDDYGEDDGVVYTTTPCSPVPPPTPRHAAQMQREHQLSTLRLQQSARLIQRRWRQFATDDAAENDGDKTDCETDAEQGNDSNGRSTKTRRRRIRKHRGRKKKRSSN